MKKTGIWMDKDKALIVILDNEEERMQVINSEMEHFNVKGGSGTRFKGGPQDVVQDGKYLEREKHQFKAYFRDIVKAVEKSDSIVVFGPAETGEKFKKELQERYATLSKKLKEVKKADSMTDNQVKAWVKTYYGKI